MMESEVEEITPTELKSRLDAGEDLVLVDVRELFEKRFADLPERGQLRIPTGELFARVRELDPSRETVVYCRTGSRSAWAALVLQERGFERVLNLKGGLMRWREEVDPTLQAY